MSGKLTRRGLLRSTAAATALGIAGGRAAGSVEREEDAPGRQPLEGEETTMPVEIDVRDFGAIPDDGQDDTMAVQAAFEEARKHASARVVFPRGRYDFVAGANPKARHVSIAIHGLRNLTVQGQGAEIMLRGYTTCFGMAGCENVTVEGFTVDVERPSFSQGTVLAVEESHFDVRIDDAYPVEGGEAVESVNDYDRETRLRVPQGVDIYWSCEGTELIAPQTLRVFTKWRFPLKEGAYVLLRHKVYAHNAFSAHNSRDITVRDNTIYTVPGMGVVGIRCHNMTVEDVRILRKPGTDRLVSATADGSHFGGCTGKVTIRDCHFEGQGDDAVNAKQGLYLTVLEQVDARTVRGRHNLNMAARPDVGEQLELTDPDTLVVFGVGTVKETETEADGFTYMVRFEDALPGAVSEGTLLGCSSRNARFDIRDCVFENNRARGALVQVHGAAIENCTFRNCTNAGVYVLVEVTHFYECGPARDVKIRNNRFINCGTHQSAAQAVIGVFGIREDWSELPEPGVFRNIAIADNIIDGSDNAGLYVNGGDGIRVTGNRIENVCRRPTGDRGKSAIVISASRDVLLEGNTARAGEQGEGFEEVLTLGPNNEADTITVRGNTGF